MSLENYEPVAERLARWLSGDFNGQPRVLTDMVSQPGSDVCVFRAELWVDTVLISTGWAEEIRGQGNVNRTSHVENCETSAIGRALANAGVAGSDPAQRVSREEMGKVQRYTQERPATSNPSSETVVRGPLQGGISDKQIGYIRGACKREGHPSPVGLDGWTKQEASAWIEAHKNGTNPGDIPNPLMAGEEPF